MKQQWEALKSKLRGHYGYFGIPGNSAGLGRFRFWVECAWRKWLSRRSQRAHLSWPRMSALLKRFPLPPPRMRGLAPASA